MNRRLNAILEKIPDGKGIIDVGTDHGYLPAALAKNGYSGNLIASDLREGPLQAARRTAEAEDLSGRIRFLLCDGLSQCDPDAVDTIVIAGLGGDAICRILDQAEWTMDGRYTILLQPMTKAEVLRYWLSNNEYEIIGEDLVEDAGKIYAVLTVRFGRSCTLSDAELFTGRICFLNGHPLFPRFLDEQIARLDKTLSGMQASTTAYRDQKWEMLCAILKTMREMRNDENSTGDF